MSASGPGARASAQASLSSSAAGESPLGSRHTDGRHFPGSSVLHWDRSAEPGDGAKTGVLLTADTMMVRMDRKGFTWMWSYPNMVCSSLLIRALS